MPIRCLAFLLALVLLPAGSALAAPLDKVLAYLSDNADAVRSRWGTPGLALAVVKGDQVVLTKCFGVRKAGAADPVTPDTVFQIASISQPFTATLAAMEIGAKRLKLTDKVCNHRPNFKMYDPWVTKEFTIEDLMAQRSGLPSAGGDLQLLFGSQRDELANALQYIPPVSSFRSEFAYQNVPFIETAYIVSQLSNQTWEQDLATRVFAPLGMQRASTSLMSFLNNPNHAALHQKQKDGSIAALRDDWPWMPVAYVVGPAGGINASLNDMVSYLIMHMNHGLYKGTQVVNAAALDDLHRPRTRLPGGILGRTAFYSQAFIWEECNGYTLVWHNGSSSGHQGILVFDPDAQVGLVVLSNLTGTSLPEQLAMMLFRMLHDQPLKPVIEKMDKAAQAFRQPAPGSAVQAKAKMSRAAVEYVGDYTSPVYGTLHVTLDGDRLMVSLGRVPIRFPLVPQGGPDTFWLELPYVDEDASGNVVFYADRNAKVQSVVLEKFRENGPPVFTRN